MKQEKIKKIIKEKAEYLSGISRQVGNGFDKDTVHDFRVAIKTLRAFLRLLELHYGDSAIKIPRKLSRLYHISGAIRDMQLELEKMKDKEPILPVYLRNLRQMLHRQKKEWLKHYEKDILRQFSNKLAKTKCKPLPPAALVAFIDLKITAAQELIAIKSLTDDQVHSIRKEVKDALYSAKLAEKKWEPAFTRVQHLSINALEQVADAIGAYNDRRIFLAHLEQFISRIATKEEQAAKDKLCKKEAASLEKEKRKTLLFVRALIGSPRT